MKLNIVTPLSRGENLLALYENVRSNYNKGVDIKWWVIIDPKAKVDGSDFLGLALDPNVQVIGSYDSAIAGHGHRNLALNIIQEEDEDSWFMSLDDDNIIHPDLIRELNSLTLRSDIQNPVGVLFDQCLKDGSKRLVVEEGNVGLNRTDTAQFVLKVNAIGDLRFDESRYDADGVFIYEFYEDHKDSIYHINKDLCYYNFLR